MRPIDSEPLVPMPTTPYPQDYYTPTPTTEVVAPKRNHTHLYIAAVVIALIILGILIF